MTTPAALPAAADTDIVLCTPRRTPVGAYGGVFAGVPVQDLASTVVAAVVADAGLTADDVEDLILGPAAPAGAAPAPRPRVAPDGG
ncbi:MAG: acetyl-CoA C-acyltransferase, partial [Corynebacterium nuruki]|nr:acetyl-CoA C-acyltransferase [Corynebacterium nuruki]